MVSAFFLAVGVIGMYLSICLVPILVDGPVGLAAIVFVVSLGITLASLFGYRRARARERTGTARRSPPGIMFGVTLLILGGVVAFVVATSAQHDLRHFGPDFEEQHRLATLDVLHQRDDAEAALAKLRDRKPDPQFPWDPQEERALQMNQQRRIDELTRRLEDLDRKHERSISEHWYLTLALYGSYVFGLLGLPLALVSIIRQVRPAGPTSGVIPSDRGAPAPG
jgi:hypothetical protein